MFEIQFPFHIACLSLELLNRLIWPKKWNWLKWIKKFVLSFLSQSLSPPSSFCTSAFPYASVQEQQRKFFILRIALPVCRRSWIWFHSFIPFYQFFYSRSVILGQMQCNAIQELFCVRLSLFFFFFTTDFLGNNFICYCMYLCTVTVTWNKNCYIYTYKYLYVRYYISIYILYTVSAISKSTPIII